MNIPFILLYIFSICFAKCPTDIQCDQTFQKCFKFTVEESDFYSAEDKCQTFGGHLISIENGFENQFVLETAKSMFDGYPYFWSGGNYVLQNKWGWTDNTTWSYTNWFPGEPSSKQAVIVSVESGLWSSSSIATYAPYVCSLPYSGQSISTRAVPTIQPTCTPKVVFPCDDGWTHFQGFCYKVFPYNKGFPDAELYCQENNAHLTSIHSEKENSFVNDMSARGYIAECFTSAVGSTWIGMQKIDNNWYWTDNTTVNYFKWAPAQPNADSSQHEICVMTVPDGANCSTAQFPPKQWVDLPCIDIVRNFVCKKSTNN